METTYPISIEAGRLLALPEGPSRILVVLAPAAWTEPVKRGASQLKPGHWQPAGSEAGGSSREPGGSSPLAVWHPALLRRRRRRST